MLEVECGDMRVVLATLPENSFDSCVCDPPYELGFMGKKWDSTGIAFDADAWRAVYRVLKPGAFICAFGGTRTWHRIACAIEDAGFEVRDSLAWLYGQGMPKSLNLSKAIDKAAGADRPVVGSRTLTGSAAMSTAEKGGTYASNTDSRGRSKVVDVTAAATELAKKWDGWGTALKPCFEPIILARKPLIGTVVENLKAHGTGGLNIDACRGDDGSDKGIWPDTDRGASRNVFGESLGAQPPLTNLTEGRWPPNVICDDEVAADLDSSNQTVSRNGGNSGSRDPEAVGNFGLGAVQTPMYRDSGGVSRYFYNPKAGSKERDAGLDHWPVLSGGEATGGRAEGSVGVRNGRAGAGRGGGRRNGHPTVKPIALMRWLCRLVTSPVGFIIDPFTGSGTTGCAAALEGFHFAGVELDPDHARLARDRIAHWAKSILVDEV